MRPHPRPGTSSSLTGPPQQPEDPEQPGNPAPLENVELLLGDVMALVVYCLYRQISGLVLQPQFQGWTAPAAFDPAHFAVSGVGVLREGWAITGPGHSSACMPITGPGHSSACMPITGPGHYRPPVLGVPAHPPVTMMTCAEGTRPPTRPPTCAQDFICLTAHLVGVWVASSLLLRGYSRASTASLPAALRQTVGMWALATPVATAELLLLALAKDKELLAGAGRRVDGGGLAGRPVEGGRGVGGVSWLVEGGGEQVVRVGWPRGGPDRVEEGWGG